MSSMMFLEILLLAYAVGGLAAPCDPCRPNTFNESSHKTNESLPKYNISNTSVERRLNFGFDHTPIAKPTSRVSSGTLGDQRNFEVYNSRPLGSRSFIAYKEPTQNPVNYEIRYWGPFNFLSGLSQKIQDYILKIISKHLPIVNYQVAANGGINVKPENTAGPKKYVYRIPMEDGTLTTVELQDLQNRGRDALEKRVLTSIEKVFKYNSTYGTKLKQNFDEQYVPNEKQEIGEVIMLPPEEDQQEDLSAKTDALIQKLKIRVAQLQKSLQMIMLNIKKSMDSGRVGTLSGRQPTYSFNQPESQKNLIDLLIKVMGKYGYNLKGLSRTPNFWTEEAIYGYLQSLKEEPDDKNSETDDNDEPAKRALNSSILTTSTTTASVSSNIAKAPCKSSSTENISADKPSTTSTTEATFIGNCNETEEVRVIPSASQPTLPDDMELDEAISSAFDKFLTATISQ